MQIIWLFCGIVLCCPLAICFIVSTLETLAHGFKNDANAAYVAAATASTLAGIYCLYQYALLQ